jgi:hypothetical protein
MIWSTLSSPRFFPILIMVLFACAAVRYAVAGNWLQTLYFACAFGLNWAVLGMEAK